MDFRNNNIYAIAIAFWVNEVKNEKKITLKEISPFLIVVVARIPRNDPHRWWREEDDGLCGKIAGTEKGAESCARQKKRGEDVETTIRKKSATHIMPELSRWEVKAKTLE